MLFPPLSLASFLCSVSSPTPQKKKKKNDRAGTLATGKKGTIYFQKMRQDEKSLCCCLSMPLNAAALGTSRNPTKTLPCPCSPALPGTECAMHLKGGFYSTLRCFCSNCLANACFLRMFMRITALSFPSQLKLGLLWSAGKADHHLSGSSVVGEGGLLWVLGCVPCCNSCVKSWSPTVQNVAKFGDGVLKEVIR